jgi:hypothetical protein
MSNRVVAAIAAAFAAGVFVLGHGPGADPDRGSVPAEGWADHMAGACEEDEMSEHGDMFEEMLEHRSGAGGHMSGPDGHMSGADGHMSGGGPDGMTNMMGGAGGMR